MRTRRVLFALTLIALVMCEVPDVRQALPDDHVRGPAAARVTVIEYGDYQCPSCTNTQRDLDALLQKYPKDVRLVYRHFPTRRHRNARIAAEAAEAAEAQGKFWEMHRKLLEHQQEWYGAANPAEAFIRYAGEIGIDRAAFAEALRVHRFERQIASSHERARQVGVRGAPALFLNGERLLPTPLSREALERPIQKALSVGGRS